MEKIETSWLGLQKKEGIDDMRAALHIAGVAVGFGPAPEAPGYLPYRSAPIAQRYAPSQALDGTVRY